MSEFDKEAEREKLREQLERDEERRQTTQQMSELLLQGATMLNVHCPDCASPIFRHEDEEFCPTCNRSIEEIKSAGTEQSPEPVVEEPASQEPDIREPPEPEPQPVTRERPSAGIPESNAGEALDAAIARLADRAATADDARQAAELMEAAHTAAEALALIEHRS